MHPDCFQVPENRPGQVVYITKGSFLAWADTAIIERLLRSQPLEMAEIAVPSEHACRSPGLSDDFRQVWRSPTHTESDRMGA